MRLFYGAPVPGGQPNVKSLTRNNLLSAASLPAKAEAVEDGLAHGRYRSAADVVLAVGKVLTLEEHVEALGQGAGDGGAEDEVGAQRQQVLVVIELVAG